ncbi:MAG: 2-aminoethylphosphonate--pyruvate transaminase [Verrucomicrobia bacterium]|nr:2-aminoethylphosphonate--pyruvate transaminase [Verrucomicrobiota bacterium]
MNTPADTDATSSTAPRASSDKLLFTPGPLTTSMTVKQSMLRDLGSRDEEFVGHVKRIRQRLLALAGVSQAAGYETVLMQGSGTFAIESVVSSVIPASGKLLAVVNGAYGQRIVQMAERHRIPATVIRCAEDQRPSLPAIEAALRADPGISHIAVVHSETTSGIFNPIDVIGRLVRSLGRVLIVDAMSSFGAVPISMAEWGVDFLVSSANKCVEGVPGFGLVIARREPMLASEGSARTLSLDLQAQWRGLEGNGQFRFTPPTHALLAFSRALDELDAEGGIEGRARRYRKNHETLVEGMRALGFDPYVPADCQGHIITTFPFPKDPRFTLEDFYQRLSRRGFVIYPGKLTQVDCFRIGNIGRLFPQDMEALVTAIRTTLGEMGIQR